MNIDKFEIWVHDHVLKNATLRHFMYGTYQRILYLLSDKVKCVGNVKKLTPDDGFEYLFGYYDKCPWDSKEKHILALRVKSATEAADSTKPADVVIINTDDGSVSVVGTTHAWNVQQGCMAQWMDDENVLYNDFRDGKYCAVVKNIQTTEERLYSMPVYTVSADKKTALTLDFSRLHRLRPGYGYANLEEETKDEICPDKTCIWKMDLVTGEIVPVLKYTDLAKFEPRPEMEGAEHKVNHLMLSPSGSRFMVLHRWFKNDVKYTRLVTCNVDGTEMYNLSDDDFVSHCCWKNENEILSYLNKKDGGKGYYLMTDKTAEYTHMWPSLAMDGHPTYSYDGKYAVTDTYPNRRRVQSIYVMDGKKVKKVATVFSPFRFGGDVRCDLHPRWSRNGKQICFDGSFDGKRGVYTVDTSRFYEKKNDAFQRTGENPNVSVIIPCYNAEKLIDETLESLENQTYQDFEVICVNDGSKDHTLQKLKEWQQKGTLDIQIIDQENGGVSKARNQGIRAARGKYLAFLDADDAFHEEMLKQLVNGKETCKADVAYCKLSRKYDDVMGLLVEDETAVAQSQKEAMDKLLYRMGDFGFYCYLYTKDVVVGKEIFFDENTKFGEDREFNWKYMCHCETAAYIDKPLYWYRPNAESVTKGKASWRKTDLLHAVKRIEQYLADRNCPYSAEFNSYMFARAMWAVAKTFAVSGDRELFDRLNVEYPVKRCMRRTASDKNKMVAIASVCYLINPKLFYKVVRLKK